MVEFSDERSLKVPKLLACNTLEFPPLKELFVLEGIKKALAMERKGKGEEDLPS